MSLCQRRSYERHFILLCGAALFVTYVGSLSFGVIDERGPIMNFNDQDRQFFVILSVAKDDKAGFDG